MNSTWELRLLSSELRASGERRISGHAAVFNSETIIGGAFREVIRPGAFTRALREKQDVRLLVNHDSNQILARTKSGTLALKEDSVGLAVSADLPDTQLGRDTWTLVKRGDLSGMSFAFIPKKENWPEDDLREILDCDLFDCSIVAWPAYPSTDVQANSALVGAEARNAKSIGFYHPGTSRRRSAQTSVPSAPAVSERDRLALRLRLLKLT